MTTPHRGLPPPTAMALPSSAQTPTGIGQLPHQWQSSEEVFKTWLQAKTEEERRKAEEERRKAEEERTKQEQIRGDTKRTELDMLRESARLSIPPPLIPIVMAGGGIPGGAGGEWWRDIISQHLGQMVQLQQQMAQQQQPPHHQQQVHQMPPVQQSPQPQTLRREPRSISQQGGGPAPHPQQMGPPPQAGMVTPQGAQGVPPPPPPQGYLPAYQLPGQPSSQRGGPQPQPPPPMQQPGPLSRLPKLDTNDPRQVQQPIHPGMPPAPMSGHPVGPPIQHTPQSSQQSQAQPETSVSQSPAIFFYHWVPPHSSGAGASTPVQATSSPQGQLGSPFNRQPQPNQLTGPEYASSPKKRKTSTQQSPSGALPPQSFSPSFHITPLPPPRNRRGHSRHRSDTAGPGARAFGEPYPKTTPRGHRRSIGEGSVHEGGPPPGDNEGGGSHHPHDQHEQQQQQQQQQHQHQHQQRQHHQQHQRQHSVPPPHPPPHPPPPPPPQHRPFSPKRETYPPNPQPPPPEGGERDRRRSKSRNSNGRD